jgi:hypothetical protein
MFCVKIFIGQQYKRITIEKKGHLEYEFWISLWEERMCVCVWWGAGG